jgi:ATP-dependent Clp protease ATP-binding subunit ClpC
MTLYGLHFSIAKWLDGIALKVGLYEKKRHIQINQGDRGNKFTRRARNVLSLAREEAQRLRQSSIGTEHLLLGLIREREGVAGQVLISSGIDLEKVRQTVEGRLGGGTHNVSDEIGMTPQAKKAIAFAFDEARRLNHAYIGTEHLLLGLLREDVESGSGVLASLGLSLQEVRAKTLQILNAQRE